ncbi:AAA family ATPase [Bacteroides sp.]|uniref:AAA family ATPase n=1 Tax=Bacteroides sp. TaxID=29523 RepID=UPI0025BE9498|nr:AAA family ATPase [Bacteroides sp.]
MIHRLEIQGYKNIGEETFRFKPVTIFTGLNSTGKSSILQAILMLAKETSFGGIHLNKILSSSFDVIRNKYTNASVIEINTLTDKGELTYRQSRTEKTVNPGYPVKILPDYENGLFYLSANRKGVENDAIYSDEVICGFDGDYIYGTYEREKSKELDAGLIKDQESHTLASQVNYWLKYILSLPIEFYTIKSSAEKVDVRFRSDSFSDLVPSQLGSGVSYLVKILILCLRASKGDVILIENPEIHLHPGAQSRLADFFTMIGNNGIQLLIETHCENLLNKFRYEVYKKELNTDDIVIYYKKDIVTPFESISICSNGDYAPAFPEGFFDATLGELLEME